MGVNLTKFLILHCVVDISAVSFGLVSSYQNKGEPCLVLPVIKLCGNTLQSCIATCHRSEICRDSINKTGLNCKINNY